MISLFLLIALNFSQLAYSCNDCKSDSLQPVGEAQQWLDTHNSARKEKGIPPLRWDNTVAKSAKKWAKQLASECRMYHSKGMGYGENLASAWGYKEARPISAVVGSWVSEKKDFAGPQYPWCKSGAVCGHYTQVMWKSTKFLGCHRSSCIIPNGKWKGKTSVW